MSTPTKPLFNIALRPIDPRINAMLTAAAQPFAPIAENYLLGPGALPHATLCMFRAEDDETARRVFAKASKPRSIEVTLDNFRVNPIQADIGIWWTALHTLRDEPLTTMQWSIFSYLADEGFEGLQKPETYDPHFTLARVNAEVPVQDNPHDLPSGLKIACVPVLGRSSDLGVFLEQIATAQPPVSRKPGPRFSR